MDNLVSNQQNKLNTSDSEIAYIKVVSLLVLSVKVCGSQRSVIRITWYEMVNEVEVILSL